MQVIKRRKVSAPLARNASTTAGIAAFTKISKVQAPPKSLLDKDVVLNEPTATQKLSEFRPRDRKRKAEVVATEDEQEAEACTSDLLASVLNQTQRAFKPLPKRAPRLPYETPPNPQTATPPIPLETPTKGARALLEGFGLSSSPTQLSSSPLYSRTTTSTSVQSSQRTYVEHNLPQELKDLSHLHSAFLTALSIHYAHNGTHTPADLRLLCPGVSRAWGKRNVMLDDIRRTLAVLNDTSHEVSRSTAWADLSLSDYGHGKICVEIRTSAGRAGNIARPVDENLLNDTFITNLHRIWASKSDETDNVASFVNNLDLEPIKICSSLAKMSPLLAKGQRRLEDMRAGVLAKKSAAAAAKSPLSTIADLEGKKPTLLERLQAKQRQAASLPPPPSKADLSRRAGLHRLEEVVAVLTLLTTSTSVGQSRVSFTLPTVLGKLKDSFKTPMSKEEGHVCVKLLADEIAPEWLQIVKLKMEQVVVNREARPSDSEIIERVRKAIGF